MATYAVAEAVRAVRCNKGKDGCCSKWHCDLLNGHNDTAPFIPSTLRIYNRSDSLGHTTLRMLRWEVIYEPFMFAALGSILSSECAAGSGSDAFFIDSGANEGLWTLLAAAHGCHALAVEPQPACVDWVEDALTLLPEHKRARVVVWNNFLSPSSNTTAVVPTDECDGGRKLPANATEAQRQPRDAREVARVNVTARRLDDVVGAPGLWLRRRSDHVAAQRARVVLWHVDVEGAEILVLRSAEKLFSERRIERVIFELMPEGWHAYGVNVTDGFRELDALFAPPAWRCVWACTGHLVGGGTHGNHSWRQEEKVYHWKQMHKHGFGCEGQWRPLPGVNHGRAVDVYCHRRDVPPIFQG